MAVCVFSEGGGDEGDEEVGVAEVEMDDGGGEAEAEVAFLVEAGEEGEAVEWDGVEEAVALDELEGEEKDGEPDEEFGEGGEAICIKPDKGAGEEDEEHADFPCEGAGGGGEVPAEADPVGAFDGDGDEEAE